MRLSRTLYAQHSGFMFKRHWLIQGRRVPIDTGAKAALEKRGVPVIDAVEYVNKKPPLEPFVIERRCVPQAEVFDQTHRLWNDQHCHTFDDSNVLLEGIPQAQLLTKSVVIDGLPSNIESAIEKINISSRSDLFMQDAVRTSFLFDAQQELLPKRKIPDRPAFVLPRDYGITETRRSRLIFSKTLQECEKLAGRSVTSKRKIVNDSLFVVPFEKDGDLLQAEVTAETFLTSTKPIAPIVTPSTINGSDLPEIYPLKYSISMPQSNIYELRDVYHVKLLHEAPITDNQLKSRSMVKAFIVAASRARTIHGSDVKDLSEPIVVQSIQFDGQAMHFGVFQLNTLDLNDANATRNVWYNGATLQLYSECLYKLGRPILGGYNPDVLRYFYGFYKNN